LRKILPAVLGRTVDFAQVTEISGLGAAILAGIGVKAYSTLDEALVSMQSSLETGIPDRLMAAEYAEYYQRWRSIGRRLKEIGEELN
jgi:sugar (pentulose or hexulose) kinase